MAAGAGRSSLSSIWRPAKSWAACWDGPACPFARLRPWRRPRGKAAATFARFGFGRESGCGKSPEQEDFLAWAQAGLDKLATQGKLDKKTGPVHGGIAGCRCTTTGPGRGRRINNDPWGYPQGRLFTSFQSVVIAGAAADPALEQVAEFPRTKPWSLRFISGQLPALM